MPKPKRLEMSPKIRFIEQIFQNFQSAHHAQNFGLACDAFVEAVLADPDIGFRYFMTRASAAIAMAMRHTQRSSEIVAILDKLLAKHPEMHLLVDYDPELIRMFIALRASHIAKGLPSVILVTQAKSASISVSNIFHSGFNLPSFAYSLANVEVIESWVRDYARGGACYTTHLWPTPQNIDRIEQAGIRCIVHVRDPRQTLLSIIHHIDRYQDPLPALSRTGFDARGISAQISELMESFTSVAFDGFKDGWTLRAAFP